MDSSLYRETILEHWRNPQNFGVLVDADFVVDESNPFCGDSIHITGKIKKGKLINVKFKGEGCVISKASASILTEYSKGKTVSNLQDLSQQDFLSLIGISLTAARLNCAFISYTALQKGLMKTRIDNPITLS